MVFGLYEYICSLTKKATLFYRFSVYALVKVLSNLTGTFRGKVLALQNVVPWLCRRHAIIKILERRTKLRRSSKGQQVCHNLRPFLSGGKMRFVVLSLELLLIFEISYKSCY